MINHYWSYSVYYIKFNIESFFPFSIVASTFQNSIHFSNNSKQRLMVNLVDGKTWFEPILSSSSLTVLSFTWVSLNGLRKYDLCSVRKNHRGQFPFAQLIGCYNKNYHIFKVIELD